MYVYIYIYIYIYGNQPRATLSPRAVPVEGAGVEVALEELLVQPLGLQGQHITTTNTHYDA